MATTKLWAIKGGNGTTGVVIKNVIEYVENPEKTEKERYVKKDTSIEIEATISNVISYSMQQKKTEEERFVSAVNCSVKNAIQEMMITKSQWKTSGNRLIWHGYQSFAPGEVTPEKAHEIGVKLAKELYDRFEVVVATHLDRQHIHNHFVINAVSFVDGKKLDWDTYYPQMKQISDRLCRENNLSVVKPDQNSGHYHRGAVRAETEGRATLESIMIEDVDACILMASDLDNFFQLMKSKGYRINTERSYIRIYPPGRNKCIRLDRRMRDKYNQGEAYTIEGIEARILANRKIREAGGSLLSAGVTESLDNLKNKGNSFTDGIPGGGFNEHDLQNHDLQDHDQFTGYGLMQSVSPAVSEDELTIPEDQDDYFTEKGIPKGKTISGIGACYIRYMTAMGVYPVKSISSVADAHYYFREDVLKLDKYINECKLLIDNNIETKDDLVRFRGEQLRHLQGLKNRRSKIQNQIRRCSDPEKKSELKEQLAQMNKEVKEQKKTVFYCYDIEENQKEMRRKALLVEKEHENTGRESFYQSNTPAEEIILSAEL